MDRSPAEQARQRHSRYGSVVASAVRMVRDRNVVAVDGSAIALEADTICLHGDTPGAAELAQAVRAGLEQSGIVIAALA